MRHHKTFIFRNVYAANVKYPAILINELSFVQVSAVTIAKSAFEWV